MALAAAPLRSLVPAALWASWTGFVLLAPGSTLPSDLWVFQFIDVALVEALVHLLLFFVLAFLLRSAAVSVAPGSSPWRSVLGVCLIYGLVLELLQIPIPGRSFQLGDLLVDALGILLALLLAALRR